MIKASNVSKCPLCAGDSNLDLAIGENRAELHRCGACGLGFYSDLPTEKELEDFYSSTYLQYSSAVEVDPESSFASAERSVNWILGRYAELEATEPTSFYDLGSGYPVICAVLKSRGFNVFAVEANPGARHWGEAKGIPMAPSIQETVPGFDVIHASHVLEHLPNPVSELRKLKALTTESGILLGAVPNWSSVDANFERARWDWVGYPEHLWNFSPLSLSLLLHQSGWEMVSIISNLGDFSTQASGVWASLPRTALELSLSGRELVFAARPIRDS